MQNTVNRGAARLLGLFFAMLLTGCKFDLLDPKGDIGVQEKNLILTSTWAMLIIVVPVILLTLFFAWRYRASNGKAAYRPDWSHSTRVEVVVWAVPAVIILFLANLTWDSTHALDPYKPIVARASPINVDVVALDWKWLFIYPDLGVASVNQMAMPVGVPVNFRITSDSAMNSFFIPQLGSQVYAMAGMATQLHLIADKEGAYDGLSANFSGAGFSDMKFKALALPEDGFRQWVAKARDASDALDAPSYQRLSAPSQADPVAYFKAVDPGLFQSIVMKYDGKRMPMQLSLCAPGAVPEK